MKFLATFIFILVLAEQAAAQPVVSVQGDYLEVRSSEVYTCGCLYSSEMVTAGKEAILVWRISSGNYQGIPLTGIKVAAVVVGENNLGVDGTLRQTALYVDGITQEAQQRTILELWRREYSLILGEIKSVHAAPVNFEQQGERVSISIPGIALVTVRKARLPRDAHPGSVLWYQPFVPLRSSSLVTTLHYEYSGADFLRQWSELLCLPMATASHAAGLELRQTVWVMQALGEYGLGGFLSAIAWLPQLTIFVQAGEAWLEDRHAATAASRTPLCLLSGWGWDTSERRLYVAVFVA